MGLYLCVFDGDDELEGVEVGSYADFGVLRDTVRDRLEGGVHGARFPTLMLHSDCDGEWSPDEAKALRRELEEIDRALAALPAVPLEEGWQREVARMFGVSPRNLAECFFDVDGEPLLARLQQLCDVAIQHQRPILFQ
jgi:hypothetical protein